MKNREFADGEKSMRTVDVNINGVKRVYICTQQEAYIIAHTLKDIPGVSCRITIGINGLFEDEEKDEDSEELTE